MDKPLRVAIDVRVPVGQWGGVQQAIQGLATGFSSLDEDVEMLFLTSEPEPRWLRSHLADRYRTLVPSASLGKTGHRRLYERAVKVAPSLTRLAGRIGPIASRVAVPIPR
jgi:hypothetical protein